MIKLFKNCGEKLNICIGAKEKSGGWVGGWVDGWLNGGCKSRFKNCLQQSKRHPGENGNKTCVITIVRY